MSFTVFKQEQTLIKLIEGRGKIVPAHATKAYGTVDVYNSSHSFRRY
jgi:hypothetical protein